VTRALHGLFALAILGAPVSAEAAEPVVVPEFSFDDNSNFALSVMLQNQVTDRLLQDGHIVLNQSVVATQVGEAAVDRCFENPGCPMGILPQLPAKVALVARIHRGGAGLMGHVELWDQTRGFAVDVRDIAILPGQEMAFVDEVARATSGLLFSVPPSDDQTLMAAARLIAGQPVSGFAGQSTYPTPAAPYPQPGYPPQQGYPAPQPAYPAPQQGYPAPQPTYPAPQPTYPAPQPTYPAPQPTYPAPQPAYPAPQPTYPAPQPAYPAPQPAYPAPQPAYPAPQPQPQVGYGAPPPPEPEVVIEDLDSDPEPIRPKRGGGGAVDTSDLRASLEGTGVRMRHVAGAQASLAKSDLDPREWLYKATPHGGRFVIEARVGLGLGDVDRQADVRVEMEGNAQTPNAYYLESPRNGSSVRGGVFLGYAPVAFFDFGAMVGLQYGKRYFTTGIRQLEDDSVAVAPVQEVPAAQVVIQPRVRAYVVPTGIAKPYVVLGADIRFFDDYEVVQPDNVQYPEPIGGIVPGFVGGGGLMIDPSPLVGVFAEGAYIRHFGGRAIAGQQVYGDWAAQPTGDWAAAVVPPLPKSGSSTISLVVGVQFRL
jgi:hypothetical protein